MADTARAVAPTKTSGAAALARPLSLALAAATIAAQIAYPLLDGDARRDVTVLVVVLFFGASVAAATARFGLRGGLTVAAVATSFGLAVEAIGVATGLPFGAYDYTDTLGAQISGVPWVIALAWAMMAYPALVVARLLTTRFVPVVAAIALASWDLFLDPQMVAESFWVWADPSPALPGVPGVPLGNYAGWLVVSLLLMTVLDRALPRPPYDEAAHPRTADLAPITLYLWTYASSVLANAAFFGRPAVAAWGGVGMGVVAVPLALRLMRHLKASTDAHAGVRR